MPACLTHIGTALPPYRLSQDDAFLFMKEQLQLDDTEGRKLKALYKATKIGQRHSVLPDFQTGSGHFFGTGMAPTTAARMGVYEKEAPKLALQAAEKCLPKNFDRSSITHLVVISCTGMYAPGLDIDLLHGLGLPFHTHRVAVQFMGCYAAFNGLKTAQAFCLADPKAKVLVVSVELCSLHFSTSLDADSLLANALFADGAAAVLVENCPEPRGLQMQSFSCMLFPQGAKDMAWRIGDLGFEMRLSSYIPQILQAGLGEGLKKMLDWEGIQLFAMHPGGAKILQAIEKALQLNAGQLQHSYQVLQDCGNMSSATIFFVWEKMFQAKGAMLSLAFGPGLTVEAAVFRG